MVRDWVEKYIYIKITLLWLLPRHFWPHIRILHDHLFLDFLRSALRWISYSFSVVNFFHQPENQQICFSLQGFHGFLTYFSKFLIIDSFWMNDTYPSPWYGYFWRSCGLAWHGHFASNIALVFSFRSSYNCWWISNLDDHRLRFSLAATKIIWLAGVFSSMFWHYLKSRHFFQMLCTFHTIMIGKNIFVLHMIGLTKHYTNLIN